MNAVRIRPARPALLQARHDAQARAAKLAADQPDHGTRTPAQAARPQRTIETIRAGIRCQVYDDATLADRMHNAGQLSDKQHYAADRVMELHAEAGFEPAVAGSYAPRGWSSGHDDDTEEAAAIGRFRQALGWNSPAAAWILHGMCLGQHPGVSKLGSLQAALSDLAKHWGIE